MWKRQILQAKSRYAPLKTQRSTLMNRNAVIIEMTEKKKKPVARGYFHLLKVSYKSTVGREIRTG
jgi:hypothetical protein